MMTDGIGDTFQRDTKYARDKMTRRGLNGSNRPGMYKEYPDKPSIALPAPEPAVTSSVDQALRQRRSIRSYSDRPLNIEQLSYLLWASTGIQRRERNFEFRTAPSAGALYPIETYIVINNVENVPQGIYHYSIKQHTLEELQTGDIKQDITTAAMGQRICSQAAVVFIWTAVFQRTKWRYQDRAYRYIYLDAGHIAQNLALSATSLGLGSCQIGALFDEEVNKIVGVYGIEESTIYMTVVGWPQ
ncbi:MAG: SagB/ThcOx family dehydrogenase [Dehalococcoidia bacterium]|nr:MAG: SagB/ThcOx family dehydrogenase [Dehalococcoidia bacterium]